jgi:hypothetical protein
VVALDRGHSLLPGDWHRDVFRRMLALRRVALESCGIPGGWPLGIGKSPPAVAALALSGSRVMKPEPAGQGSMVGLWHMRLCGRFQCRPPAAVRYR